MRKFIGDRSTALKLSDVADDEMGVRPETKMTASAGGVHFARMWPSDNSYDSAFSLHDEDAIREVRDQLDEWLSRHADGDE